MFASQFLSPAVQRVVAAVSHVVRKFLMLAGLVFVLGLAGSFQGRAGFLQGLQAMFPADVNASEPAAAAVAQPVADETARLVPSMQKALNDVARRYRVSREALLPIFLAAQDSAREQGLDPLLVVAVIGVESGFNPFSQSVVGAQGLMQVMPRFHADKLPQDAGELPFFDPVTNVLVGTRVLRESIARNGGLIPGLQQFGGAIEDPAQRYANKVLAERRRLEAAIRQGTRQSA